MKHIYRPVRFYATVFAFTWSCWFAAMLLKDGAATTKTQLLNIIAGSKSLSCLVAYGHYGTCLCFGFQEHTILGCGSWGRYLCLTSSFQCYPLGSLPPGYM